MNQTYINLTASNQHLSIQGEPLRLASKTVNFVKAHFELGENWDGFDSVRAVWSTDFNKGVSTVLDSLGDCVVPHEILSRAGIVRVNLVGSISEDDVLTDRLTTCLVSAIMVCCNVFVDGTEPQTITPTQFEQFVEAVRDDADRAETASTEARESATEASESATSASQSASASAESATASEQAKDLAQGYAQNAQISAQTAENAKDDAEDARDEILGMRAEAVTLPEGSEATASYADGLLSLGIPRGNTGAKGDKGDTGDTGATPNLTIGTVETLEPSEPATATITGTAENPVLNLGIPQGDTGEVSLADLSTLLPTDTASGSIASFSDGQSVIPMVSLLADIEPIQSGTGTPSPDNVRPISGRTEVVTHRTGKNLFDKSKATLGKYINPTPQEITKPEKAHSDYIKIKPNTLYYMSGFADSGYYAVLAFDENDNRITWYGGASKDAPFVVTTPSNARFAILNFNIEQIDTLMFCESSEAVAYEPYHGDTYTTDLGQTVYGGTLDVVSGELVVDRAMTTFDGSSDETWTVTSIESVDIYIMSVSDALSITNSDGEVRVTSNLYQSVSANTATHTGRIPNSIALVQNHRLFVTVPSGTYENVSAFKSALSTNPLQVVYELATPQTIQLTPQEVYALLGQNNVWADSGSVEVVYKADVTKWVEKKLNS